MTDADLEAIRQRLEARHLPTSSYLDRTEALALLDYVESLKAEHVEAVNAVNALDDMLGEAQRARQDLGVQIDDLETELTDARAEIARVCEAMRNACPTRAIVTDWAGVGPQKCGPCRFGHNPSWVKVSDLEAALRSTPEWTEP